MSIMLFKFRISHYTIVAYLFKSSWWYRAHNRFKHSWVRTYNMGYLTVAINYDAPFRGCPHDCDRCHCASQ